MSAAKTLRVEDKLLKRGWQISKAYYEDAESGEPFYLVQLCNYVKNNEGKQAPWALRVRVSHHEATHATCGVYAYWEHLYERLLRDAEVGLLAAQQKLLEGELDGGREPEGTDAERIAREDSSPRPSGLVRPSNRILDAGGNYIS